MDSFVHFENFFCGLIFKFGRHQYLGKFIPAYQIEVCDRCYNENPNGWDKDAQKELLPYLTVSNNRRINMIALCFDGSSWGLG